MQIKIFKFTFWNNSVEYLYSNMRLKVDNIFIIHQSKINEGLERYLGRMCLRVKRKKDRYLILRITYLCGRKMKVVKFSSS